MHTKGAGMLEMCGLLLLILCAKVTHGTKWTFYAMQHDFLLRVAGKLP